MYLFLSTYFWFSKTKTYKRVCGEVSRGLLPLSLSGLSAPLLGASQTRDTLGIYKPMHTCIFFPFLINTDGSIL